MLVDVDLSLLEMQFETIDRISEYLLVVVVYPLPWLLLVGSRLWSTSQLLRPSGQQCSHSGGVCPQIQGRQCGAYVGAVEEMMCRVCGCYRGGMVVMDVFWR